MKPLHPTLLVLFLCWASLGAQAPPHVCGTIESPEKEIVPAQYKNGTSCYDDVSFIINDCSEVWVRTNLHFFVSDECTGLTGGRPGKRLDQKDVFQKAQEYIDEVNFYLGRIGSNIQRNQAVWGATVTEPQCVPVRFHLDEVYIHCNSARQNSITKDSDIASYIADPLYENDYNIFVSDVVIPTIPDASGFTKFNSKWAVVESFGEQNLVHEFGHSMDLRHTHRNTSNNDGCDDTPWYEWQYDVNGNGTIDFNEIRRTCWSTSSSSNGDCSIQNPHPCCSETYVNNNVMTYSAPAQSPYVAAMTPCQVNIMMETLLFDYCEMVEVVDPICPPASAHIGLLPTVDPSEDCIFTLDFTASTNYELYEYTIQKQNPDGSFSIIWTSGFQSGNAGRLIFAVGDDQNPNHVNLTLDNESVYEFRLRVSSDCSQDSYFYLIETGDCELDDQGGGGQGPAGRPGGKSTDVNAYPNPTWGSTNIEYTLDDPEAVEVYVVHGASGPLQKIYSSSGRQETGSYLLPIDESQLREGVNRVLLIVGDQTTITQIIKQ